MRILVAGLAAICGQSATAEEIDVGSRERIARLFSFPNNCHVICFLPQTLEQTIEVYLRKSLERDGFTPDVTVKDQGGTIQVRIGGQGGAAYKIALPAFLRAGDAALSAAQRLHAQGKWRYNWRFFLPLGLPLINNKSVQLLHFPPDYVLEEKQDYLQANTTTRWAELLVLNGAAAQEADQFQAIVDIAPISAPASDGRKLEGIYDDFRAYIDLLIEFWAVNAKINKVKPMVAFGGPVRDYIEHRYGSRLQVLDYAALNLADGRLLPTLGSNHPSRFYNAVNSFLEENPTDKEGAVRLGMRIAHDDLVAACWQVEASKDGAEGSSVLAACRTRWKGRPKDVCNIVIQQRFREDDEAKRTCLKDDLPSYLNLTEAFIATWEGKLIAPEIQ